MTDLGGGAADAIINSDPGTDGGESSTDDTDTDGGEGGESTEESESQPGSGKPESKEGTVDWKTVPAEVKAHIQEIAKANPKLANQLQNAVYTANNFLKEVPGGLKEIRAMKSEIENLGGIEEIRQLNTTHKALVEEQEALDNKARSGDPDIVNNLVEIAGNEGFSKLMPHTLSKWANMDPQGYSHEMSKIMVNAMRDGGMVANLNLAFKMLKLGTPEAIKEATDCLNQAALWANDVNKIANTAPERPKVDPNIASEQAKIDAQKTQLFNQEFASSFGRWRSAEITREITQITGGKALNDYQMQTLTQRVIDDMKSILTSDNEYMKNLDRYYNARDMNDLLKFSKSRTSKILSEVTKKAYRSLFTNPGAKKVSKVTTPTDKNAAPVKNTPVVQGWAKVEASKAPKPDEIDSKRTTFEMKFRKQAILKNGKKVYWGAHTPA
jgi:hypothetical protein